MAKKARMASILLIATAATPASFAPRATTAWLATLTVRAASLATRASLLALLSAAFALLLRMPAPNVRRVPTAPRLVQRIAPLALRAHTAMSMALLLALLAAMVKRAQRMVPVTATPMLASLAVLAS